MSQSDKMSTYVVRYKGSSTLATKCSRKADWFCK